MLHWVASPAPEPPDAEECGKGRHNHRELALQHVGVDIRVDLQDGKLQELCEHHGDDGHGRNPTEDVAQIPPEAVHAVSLDRAHRPQPSNRVQPGRFFMRPPRLSRVSPATRCGNLSVRQPDTAATIDGFLSTAIRVSPGTRTLISCSRLPTTASLVKGGHATRSARLLYPRKLPMLLHRCDCPSRARNRRKQMQQFP